MASQLKLRAAQGIFLLGFMGSGKTTVGSRLAGRLGRPFVDLDGRIEAAAGCPISEIFQREGEAAFRARETRTLSELLAQVKSTPGPVIALGGGAFAQPGNRELLDRWGGLTVFLECPLEELMARCAGLQHRPLFGDPVAFERLYQERLPAYRQALFTVSTASGTPDQVAETIAGMLAQALS